MGNVVTMTVFIKESRYGDRFVEMRKEYFKDGNYPGSALITVTNFARPGIEIEIHAVGLSATAVQTTIHALLKPRPRKVKIDKRARLEQGCTALKHACGARYRATR